MYLHWHFLCQKCNHNPLQAAQAQDLNILKLSEDGKVLKDGIKTVILGKPNVGKSSLLNALLEEEKAIVTDVKGTTRDIVEGSIIVGGVKLNLIDTAGVRKTTDIVEKIGIERILSLLDEAE